MAKRMKDANRGWSQAGWAVRYEGVKDPEGYRLEYLSVTDQRSENVLALGASAAPSGALFIIPNSGKSMKFSVGGERPEGYLQFVNLRRSRSNERLLQFVNQYGITFLSDDYPTLDGVHVENADEVFRCAEKFGEYVGRLRREESMLPILEFPFGYDLPCSINIHRGRFLTVITRSLVEYFHLQIAIGMLRGDRLAHCEACEAIMKQVRTTRAYCSDACRTRASRKRQKKLGHG